jgi:hypothetical protein
MGDTEKTYAFNCSNDKSFTISFDFTPTDATGVGYPNIKMMYDNIIAGDFLPSISINDKELEIDSLPKVMSKDTTFKFITGTGSMTYTLSSKMNIDSYAWLYIAYLFTRFKVDPKRLCSVKINPIPNDKKIEYIKFRVTIGDPIPNSEFANDNSSAECIKNMVFAWIKQYVPTDNNTDVEEWLSNGTEILQNCKSGFTSSIYNETEYMDDVHINSIGVLSNIEINNNDIENYTSDDVLEHISGFTAVRGSASPNTMLDYIFMYSIPFACLGSMAYAILSITQMDVSSVMINKNVIIFMNAYIVLCGFFAYCAWFNIDITNISIGNININKWFSLAVVKLDIKA